MFKLLRRISSSIYPRLDRPWSDDATSNAPTIGRKRRLSDEDDDGDDVRDAGSSRKRRAPLEREGMSELGELRGKGTETDPGVKEVTRGVKELPATPEGEPSVAPPPHDPTQPPQGDDQPSTTPNDEAPIVQSETIAEAPSNDSPDVRTPESPNVEEPLEDEKESTGAAPDAGNDEVACATEPVEPSPKPEATTSTPEANDGTSQEQQEQ
ncbi:hypothetical protein EDB92DRAFT_1863218 [Lactarius akahatsu]|uniref:Uncharacterized protein n=1 Tax=Lactarius akahatsu TaxID=416441 RepID=A0AAD4QDA4_9AGAM|nr:hypothetical protein EDB92DRAFT_1863218 [Lactarius akahatsu]